MESVAITVASGSTTATLDLFDQTLGNDQRFLMTQVDRSVSARSTLTVHLTDMANKTLLIMKCICEPMRYAHAHAGRHEMLDSVTSCYQITNASGLMLLTGKDYNLRTVTAWCGAGGEYLGKLDYWWGLCSATLDVFNCNDEVLFTMERNSGGVWGGDPSELSLIANGVTLARIQRLNETAAVEINFSKTRNSDTLTKVLLIVAAYHLFRVRFASIAGATNGLHSQVKSLYFRMIFMLLMCIAIVIVSVGFSVFMIITTSNM